MASSFKRRNGSRLGSSNMNKGGIGIETIGSAAYESIRSHRAPLICAAPRNDYRLPCGDPVPTHSTGEEREVGRLIWKSRAGPLVQIHAEARRLGDKEIAAVEFECLLDQLASPGRVRHHGLEYAEIGDRGR